MEATNQTGVPRFLLLGLTEDPALQPLVFSLFLSVYLVTVLGNLLIILAVGAHAHLHTPMYFFLSTLSITDLCISTTTIPKMLVDIQARDHSASYPGCLSQLGFVLVFGGLENCLLAAMAYDRYVAICQPLRYAIVMSTRVCLLLALLCLGIATGNALLHTLLLLPLAFGPDVEIPHFFCELVQVIGLSCSDTSINILLVHLGTSLFAGVPLLGIIVSYSHIVTSVLRIPSGRGRHRAFSTCGSHLSVVCLFYATGIGVYMSSEVTASPTKNAMASVMYIVVPQMLNPFVYSLRNREMKGALRQLITGVPPGQ
ncbi:olfactory receptor 7G2-like [Dipodomys merriami]|uniref:olfactory receptor 7G2-like n=1 Tax=Dipodomys merriami TaxID=94247 RepID=UPI003855A167